MSEPIKLTVRFYGETYNLTPVIGLYSAQDFMSQSMPGLAIQFIIADGPEKGIPFGNLTVNLGDFIGQKNCVYIDNNDGGEYTPQLLKTYPQYFKDTGLTKTSGFCRFPLWKLSDEFLKGCKNYDIYEQYSECFDDYMADKPVNWDEDQF